MDTTITFLNFFLYLFIAVGTLFMLMGVATSDKIRFRKGFKTLLVSYLCLNLLAWSYTGTLNYVVVILASRFGVSPGMFFIDVLVGMFLGVLFLNYIATNKVNGPKLSIVKKK